MWRVVIVIVIVIIIIIIAIIIIAVYIEDNANILNNFLYLGFFLMKSIFVKLKLNISFIKFSLLSKHSLNTNNGQTTKHS